MFKCFRQAALDPLSVSMAGAKLGDRVLVVGCGDPYLVAGLAAKAGLTGRLCAVDASAQRATEAGRVALKEGALAETSTADPSALPFEAESFDLVVMRDVAGSDDAARAGAVKEAWRVLRPGGRCLVVDTVARSGMSAFFSGGQAPPLAASESVIATSAAQGFVAVRLLAEREGLRFVEAVKRNS
jgi:ubiquinone/menaquinone biosynthesis C-methylase UbiE